MIKVFATQNMHYTPFKGFHEMDLPFLEENGIRMVDKIEESDVIVSQHFKQLKPLFFKFRNTKKYLIWTLEPRFNIHSSPIKKFFMGFMTVHVMNIYTGDVFVNSLSYHSKNISQRIQPLDLSFTFSNKLLVGLMSYYKGLQTEKVLFKGVDVDLIKKRTAIALYGHEKGQMHVYGKGWPDGFSIEDSREGDWGATKKNILDMYHFNLAFENTVAPKYTTEKIWDSIENYCLPVYFGKGSDIYDIFPENSFLDYSKINSPKQLFEEIQQTSTLTYMERMNKCIGVYNRISVLDASKKNIFRQQSLEFIISRLQQITVKS
jgi:hypothetical protein